MLFSGMTYEFVESQRGKQLILLQGYTFWKHSTYQWKCSSALSMKCPAKLFMKDGLIINFNLTHVHPPPNIHPSILEKQQAQRITYQYVETQHEKHLILLEGYTFSKNSKYQWTCSSAASMKCPAKLFVKDNVIWNFNLTHVHPSPNVQITVLANGNFKPPPKVEPKPPQNRKAKSSTVTDPRN